MYFFNVPQIKSGMLMPANNQVNGEVIVVYVPSCSLGTHLDARSLHVGGGGSPQIIETYR